MKVTPISASGQAIGAVTSEGQPGREVQQSHNLRSIKMSTQASPLQAPRINPEPIEQRPPGPDSNPLTISDNNESSEGAEDTKPLSPQLAQLAKMRRALQVKERELAEREKALGDPKQEKGVALERIKSDPMGVLREAGLTYDDLTKAVLNDPYGNHPELHAFKQRIDDLEQGFESKLQEQAEAGKRQVIAQMMREAEQLAADEKYELVRTQGKVPEVIQLIERIHQETGDVVSVSEAMQMFEDELMEDALKLARSQKVQGKLAPPSAQPSQAQSQFENRQPRTLSNRDTAQVPMDRKQRALMAFLGQLKK